MVYTRKVYYACFPLVTMSVEDLWLFLEGMLVILLPPATSPSAHYWYILNHYINRAICCIVFLFYDTLVLWTFITFGSILSWVDVAKPPGYPNRLCAFSIISPEIVMCPELILQTKVCRWQNSSSSRCLSPPPEKQTTRVIDVNKYLARWQCCMTRLVLWRTQCVRVTQQVRKPSRRTHTFPNCTVSCYLGVIWC